MIAAVLVLATGITALLSGMREAIDYRHAAFAWFTTLAGLVMIPTVLGYPPQWPPAWALPKAEPPPRSTIEILKDALSILGVVGIAGAVIAFWYTNLYLPSTRLPAVNVEVALAPVRSAGTSLIHATVTATNASDFRVRVVSSFYDLVVEDAGAGYDQDRAKCSIEAETQKNAGTTNARLRRLGRGNFTVADAGSIFPLGSFLEPQAVRTFGFVVPLPDDNSTQHPDVVRAYVALEVARGDGVGIERRWAPREPSWDDPAATDAERLAAPCDDPAGYSHTGSVVWPLVEESAFNGLTRDPLELWSDWWLASDGWVGSVTNVYTTQGYDFEMGATSDRQTVDTRLLQRWGLVSTSTVEEVVVP